ncbi:MAG: hypothetical protein EHM72_07530 [Calditrichaeota bacterium]|nr:MAG: hypothetical protein EHM72_07530 [Calditrichota bacterium]
MAFVSFAQHHYQLRDGMKIISFRTVIAFIMIFSSVALIGAQDWPQWRGAHRDGKLSTWVAPAAWPQTLNKKWTTPVGLGDSSPALVENRLYAHGRQNADEVISCIDAVYGELLWRQAYPAEMVASGPSASHPGPRSSPVVVDGKLVTLGVGGILSCFDAATGTLLWRKQSAADYLNTPYQFETSMSPMMVNDECIVYIGGDEQGALIGFALADGQPRWKYSGGAPSPSSPMIMTVDGVPQIVTLSEKNVFAVSLQDHSLLWSLPFESRPVNSTTPVIHGQTVYVTGQGMGVMAIAVSRRQGQFAAEIKWNNSTAQVGTRFTTPVYKEGLLFGHAANDLICLNAETGELLWTNNSVRGPSASIVDAGSCLIALGINGEMVVYQPSGKEYRQLAWYQVGAPEIWAHPLITENRIYIRDKDSVTLWMIE